MTKHTDPEVKKVSWYDGKILKEYSTDELVVIEADQTVHFQVDKDSAESKEHITWILENAKGKLLHTKNARAHNFFGLQIPKKLCGLYTYFLTASFASKKQSDKTKGLHIRGKCEEKITAITWNRETAHLGEEIKLKIETEGLNGECLKIQIFPSSGYESTPILEYQKVTIDGSISLLIPWTLLAQPSSQNIKSFYCKVSKNQPFSSLYFNQPENTITIDYKHSQFRTNAPQNVSTLKVSKPDVSVKKYEFCRFDKITIVDDGASVPVFSHEKRAQTPIVYQTIAPSKGSKEKNLTINIDGFNTDYCLRDKDEHRKTIKIINPSKAEQQGEDIKLDFPVYSELPEISLFPLKYLMPSNCLPEVFLVHIHSCRDFPNDDLEIISVEVYPDIKWEFAFELQINVSNYKAANMPYGNIFAKHQEKAREAGYERWLLMKDKKVPISVGFGIAAEWNDGKQKCFFTTKFKKKIEDLANMISIATNLLQDAINSAKGVAKESEIPISFDIRYPKFKAGVSYKLERIDGRALINTVGRVSFSLDPLIGAEAVVDILGSAIIAASYGLTGNPAAAKLIDKFRKGIDKLGASVTFTATFYGELHMMFDALSYDSVRGVNMDGKTTIGGKMGVTIILAIEIGGKFKAQTKKCIINFKAAARLQGDAWFGGDFVFNADQNGFYVQPVLKFSGVMITGEVEGEVGWWKTSFKLETNVIDESVRELDKHYMN